MEKQAPKSVTFLTPEDLEPLTAQLADHEERLVALESGEGIPPDPGNGGDGETLAIGTWYSAMNRFAELAAWGFTHAHEWAYPDRGSLGYLDAAHAHGLQVMLELSWAMEGNHFYPDRLAMQMCPEYIAHPALAGWLPYDEPDLRQTPVGEMQKIYDAIKAKDPAHPVKLTIRYPWKSTGQPYLPYGDIIAVDPYPIPYGPPEQAGDETAEAVASHGLNGKPMWTDVQTMDWKNTFVPPEVTGRMPTANEVETMGVTSIQAQTHAQKGVYCYLESEMLNSADIRNNLGGIVASWRALVPGASRAFASRTLAKPTKKFPPLPAHPLIDALKKKMREEKGRLYPNPNPQP